MKKLLIFIVIHFWFTLSVFPQSDNNISKSTDSISDFVSLANTYILENNFEKALDFSIKAVSLARNSKDKNLKGEAYASLANSYQIIGDQSNAEKHFKTALNFGHEADNHYVIMAASNGLGNVYSASPETQEKAITYYEEFAKYALKSKEPERVFIASLNTATLFLEKERPDKAFKYIQSAKESFKSYKESIPLYKVTLDYVIGSYYKQKQQYDKALVHLDKSLELAKQNDLILDIIDIYKAKSEIYQNKGQFTLAIENLKAHQKYKDLNFDTEKNEQIEKAKAQFRVSEVEHKLDIANKEKEYLSNLSKSKEKIILITIIGIVLLLGILILLIYSYNKRKLNYELKINNKILEEDKNNAERLAKHKSEFITRVSHELRTPLYGVVGITSMLQEDKELTNKHGDLLDSLKFSGDHLSSLVNNVLKISKIDSQDIQLNQTNTDLKFLLKNIVSSLEFLAKENGNNLKLSIDNTLSKSYKVDSVRLSEILLNLIDNAIKFTSNGQITVSATLLSSINGKGRILFEVEDNGIGISTENERSIFENFNQVNEEENTYEGAGLGLSVVKHLLEIMDSEIFLKSTLNEGSKFSFTLNLSESEISNTTQCKTEIKTPRNILIVEDNKISQMVTSNLIKLIGHQYTIAENGKIAIDLVKTNHFDLILMDLNMPLMNGYDATKTIKSLYPNLNIIALTANEVSEVYDKCIKIGMSEVINKPLSKPELDSVLYRYLY